MDLGNLGDVKLRAMIKFLDYKLTGALWKYEYCENGKKWGGFHKGYSGKNNYEGDSIDLYIICDKSVRYVSSNLGYL